MDNETAPLSRTVAGRPFPAVGRWVFEGGNSSIAFWVKHMMISKVRGAFRDFSGEIVVAPDPADSKATARIAAASIDTGMPYRDKDLRGGDFLDVERHPEITFVSTGLTEAGEDWELRGELTIAGTTREVSLAVEFAGAAVDPWGNRKAVFSASTKLNREDWGLTYNKAIESGGVLIGSAVTIDIEIQAKPATGEDG